MLTFRNLAPIFVILTQANVNSLRLVATQLAGRMGFEPIYILHLAVIEGIEPSSPDRQSRIITVIRYDHCLVASTGNDPVSIGYQPIALPLSYEAVVFGTLYGFRSRFPTLKG